MVKPRNNNNRRRNNNHRRPGGNNGSNLESNGPFIKVRGSAKQIYEKYLTLARDAQSAGDNVLQESYFQHGEHYARLLIESGKFEKNENNSDEKASPPQESNENAKNKNTEVRVSDTKEEKLSDSKEENKENVISIPESADLDVAEGS